MSHFKERKQKDCLNCGADVLGRYCHLCGQENLEPKETVWHLVTHFVYDITHFDGKFFSTVKYLLLKPGFLSQQYMQGKRASYLNPIKMYVFTSAFFFIFFFSVFNAKEIGGDEKIQNGYPEIINKIEARKADLDSSMRKQETPEAAKALIKKQIAYLNSDLERLKGDTTNLENLNYYKMQTWNLHSKFETDSIQYASVEEYKAKQNSLPAEKKDGWLTRQYRIKKIDVTNKFVNDSKVAMRTILDKFFHFFPQIFFLSLPIFALLLKLLYVRKKQYYYADHAIYSFHLYCAVFIFIFLLMVLTRVAEWRYFNWVSYGITAFSVYIAWYNYKGLRVFYHQSRGKTILKLLILLLMSFFLITFLFLIFFLLSIFIV